MKFHEIQKWFVGVLALLLAGCSLVPGASAGAVVQSQKARQAAPQVGGDDLESFTKGNRGFAVDMYHALDQGEANFFFSPYSISLALAMTYAGARGETEQQMAQVLHFTLSQDRLHPAANALDLALAARKDTLSDSGEKVEGFQLNIVNDLWGQKEYKFLQDYLDLLAANYGAGLRLMDFRADPDGSRQEINRYIAEKTQQRIKDLIPSGAIDPATRLVLTNAIYFKAAWKHAFVKELTQNHDFMLLDGSKIQTPQMRMGAVEQFLYLKREGFQAVALPYVNPDLSMVVVLPDGGAFDAFESSLSADDLDDMVAAMQLTPVVVQMPAFTFESEFSLGDHLQSMGMTDAFTNGLADFSGMNGDRELSISEVIHKAFVAVDEEGTEAAAATAVIMRAASAPMDEPVQFTVDRPFIFMIYDRPTNSILFLGRVTDPTPK